MGVTGAALSLRLMLRLLPSTLPRLAEIAINARVLTFAFVVCLVVGVLFAGLLSHSFWQLTHADPGFNPRNAIVARIWLPQPNDPKQDPYAKLPDRVGFVREVLRRVRTLPGIDSASMSTSFPLNARGNANPVTLEGLSVRSGEATLAEAVSVTPDYFRVLGTPLLAGRVLTEEDRIGEPLAVLVDRSTAARFWPHSERYGFRRPGAASLFRGIDGCICGIGSSACGYRHLRCAGLLRRSENL